MVIVAQRPVYPAPQQAAAHRRRRAVDDPGQRALRPAGHAVLKLEITAGCRVHDQGLVAVFSANATQLWNRRKPGFFYVLDKRARRVYGNVEPFAAESLEITCSELLAQQTLGGLVLKMPRWTPRYSVIIGQSLFELIAFSDKELGRAQAFKLAQKIGDGRTFADQQAAAANVEPRQAIPVLARLYRGEQIVAVPIQQGFFDDGARRDDADDFSLDRAFRQRGVTDLFADRHGKTLSHESCKIGVCTVNRNSGHRNRLPRGAAATCKRNVNQGRGASSVVVKQFIKIAHAIEEQHIRAFRLDPQVLLHHGRVARRFETTYFELGPGRVRAGFVFGN